MNHAAFDRADVEDARRGHPDSDLRADAQRLGLDYRGQELAGHFSGLNPVWVDYVFNSMRGALVPGRFGIVQHELYEIALGDDGEPYGSGEYYGRRTVAKPGLRSLIGLRKTPKNEPFAAQAMWLPVTAVKVLVPEAALVPRTVIATAPHLSLGDPKLGDAAPGYRVRKEKWLSPELLGALGERVGPILAPLDWKFVRVVLAYGALGMHVNGFVADPARLDVLVATGGALAEAFSEIGREHWRPAPFGEPLDAFDASQHPQWWYSFEREIDGSGMEAFTRHSQELGLRMEDPVALHRAFPTLPIPGTSRGVLAGTLPGSAALGRLTWQYQGDPRSSSYLRGAGLFAARADAEPTVPGGVRLADTDMYYAVGGGLACCWARLAELARLDGAALAERCVATMRATGAAEV